MYMSWKEILEKILEYGTLPTVLIYEEINKNNIDNDAFDRIDSKELEQLERRAYDLQKFIDQYEIAEAKANKEKSSNEPKAIEEKKANSGGVVPDPKSQKLKQGETESEILADLYK